jgi:protein SCO1/2
MVSLVAVGGGLGLSACSNSAHGSPNAVISQTGGPPETSADYPGALLFPRTYGKPDVTLTDTSGDPYNIAASTHDALTLVYFGYTHCPDLCPLNMATAAAAIGEMPTPDRRRVTVVFVSTDPARDTPTVIRTWLDHFDNNFVGLTGTLSQIQQTEVVTGIPLSFAEHSSAPGSSYEVVHAGYILVYTQDNRAHLEFPAEITVSQESHDLANLLQHGWQP